MKFLSILNCVKCWTGRPVPDNSDACFREELRRSDPINQVRVYRPTLIVQPKEMISDSLKWMPIFLPQTVPLEFLQRVGPWRACANLSRTLWPHRLCRSTVSPWWPSLEVEILWRCLILLVQQSTFSPQDWRSRPMLIPTPWFEECSCIVQVRSANDVQLGLLPSCFSRTIFCPPCWLCLSPHTWARWGRDGSQRWSSLFPNVVESVCGFRVIEFKTYL